MLACTSSTKNMKNKKQRTQDAVNAILEMTKLPKKATLFDCLRIMLKHCGDNVKSVKMHSTKRVQLPSRN